MCVSAERGERVVRELCVGLMHKADALGVVVWHGVVVGKCACVWLCDVPNAALRVQSDRTIREHSASVRPNQSYVWPAACPECARSGKTHVWAGTLDY